MILHRGSRKGRRLLYCPVKAIIEQLEQRQLLTAIHGGDTFEFADAAGNIVRVKADGPSSAQFDLIGATLLRDPNGQFGQTPTLNQVPGRTVRPNGTVIDTLGGVGGADGVEPIGVITGAAESETDLIGGPPGTPARINAPSIGINLVNISSNSVGDTFGFNVRALQQNVPPNKTVELYKINYKNAFPAPGVTPADATFVQDVAPQIAALTGAATTDIGNVVACDFLPSNDNLLYFICTVSVMRTNAIGGGTPTAALIPFSFIYDFSQPAGSAVRFANPAQREFVSDPLNAGAGDVAPTILGMTFTSNDRMVLMVTARAVGGRGDTTGIGAVTGLTELAANNPIINFLNVAPVQLANIAQGGQPTIITDLRSLEVIPGDDDFVYGISGTGNTSILLHVNRLTRPNALAVNFGPLPDPDDLRTPQRGTNLGDLDWNPALKNFFFQNDDDPSNDNKLGALIAEDVGTDELVTIDQRDRFPATNLFAIYGSHTTLASSISVASVPSLTTPVRPMLPFTGDAGPMQVTSTTGDPNTVIATGPGGVFIGARTLNVIQNTTTEENRPIRRIAKPKDLIFGNFPSKSHFVYAGITINGNIHNVLIGGTVTGNVKILGSIDTLYAGALYLGEPNGLLAGQSIFDGVTIDLRKNLYVQNDARNILTLGSMGSDGENATNPASPNYLTGLNVAIGGKLGRIKAAAGSVINGNIAVSNTFKDNGASQLEVEDKRGNPLSARTGATYFEGFLGGAPSLGDLTIGAFATGAFNNDTFATADYLGTSQNRALGNEKSIVVNGRVSDSTAVNGPHDAVDMYRVSLLAGQRITVQLSARLNEGGIPVSVGVFDPDDRLIDTDRSVNSIVNQVRNTLAGQPFSFTADRPGDYRFAIGGQTDAEFNGNGGIFGWTVPYTLRVTNLGIIALGGVQAGASVFTNEPGIPGISVHRGDLGGVTSDSSSVLNLSVLTLPYDIPRGNLRSIEAPFVGTHFTNDASFTTGDSIDFVVGGVVGLIRSTAGQLVVNANAIVTNPDGTPNKTIAAKGDIQLADAATLFEGNLLSDRGVGVVRAGTSIGSIFFAPFIIANADLSGSDGVIDLLDTPGTFGTLPSGGPHLYTGPGGNVRYIHVGGAVFKSSVFGGSQVLPTVLTAGSTRRLIDDSGTSFKISPTPLVVNPNRAFVTDPAFLNPGNLSYIPYAVDDHKGAGVVLVDLSVDTTFGTGSPNHGVLIETGATGRNGSVEIGTIHTFDDGNLPVARPVIENDPIGGGPPSIRVAPRNDPTIPITAPSLQTPVDIVMKGGSTIDAFSIVATGKGTRSNVLDNIDLIDNRTDGEIVNVLAANVGRISAQRVGLAKGHIGVDKAKSNAVEGFVIQDNGAGGAAPGTSVPSPFIQQRNLILIDPPGTSALGGFSTGGGTGHLIEVAARAGVGNILVNGIIGKIVANADGTRNPNGGFEGIDGPIVAVPGPTDTAFDARIQSVTIGQGINFGGRGDVPFAGLFAGDAIQSVVGSGRADVRGPISVGGTGGLVNSIDNNTITSITLINSSIINAYVGETSSFTDFRNIDGRVIPEFTDDGTDDPHFEIGSINIEGNGGIIGSFIEGADIGPITIDGGFGFLGSFVNSLSDNLFAGITASGYGIRDSFIRGMSFITRLDATGNGKLLDTRQFEKSVLLSAGSTPSTMDPFFGTAPNEDTDLYKYLKTSPKTPVVKTISRSGVIQDLTVQVDQDLAELKAYQVRHLNRLGFMSLAIGNEVKNVQVVDGVNGLTLSSGKLDKFSAGSDVSNSSIDISGRVSSFAVGGTFRGTSELSALGPEGSIDTVKVRHAIFGNIFGTVNIGDIIAGTDLGSHAISTIGTIDLLQVGGSIVNGAHVANIKNKQDRPFKRLNKLVVAKNIEAGATIRVQSLGKQQIGGVVNGNIIVG